VGPLTSCSLHRLLTTVLSADAGAIATEDQVDALLESVITRAMAGRGQLRADPPTETDQLVDATVLLLARHSVARLRPGLRLHAGNASPTRLDCL
jgi:hypothetical protein